MTGAELESARRRLGEAWGLKRPIKASELGRLLRLAGRDPGARVRGWETGAVPVPDPVQVAVLLMLGAKSGDMVKGLGRAPRR